MKHRVSLRADTCHPMHSEEWKGKSPAVTETGTQHWVVGREGVWPLLGAGHAQAGGQDGGGRALCRGEAGGEAPERTARSKSCRPCELLGGIQILSAEQWGQQGAAAGKGHGPMAGVTMPPSREEPELSELLQSRGASGSVGAQRAALWGEDEDDFNTINNLIGPPEAAGPRTHILLHCAQRQGPARPAGCAGGTREHRRGEGTVWKTEVHSFTAEVSFSGQLTVQSSNFQLGCCKNFKTCNTWPWSQGHWPRFPQTVE